MMDGQFIDLIRKCASIESGRRFLEQPEGSAIVDVLTDKYASADPELMKIAAWMGGDPTANYQALGGKLVKQSVSANWVRQAVQSGAQSASPQRLGGFVAGMRNRALSVRQTRGTSMPKLMRGMKLEGNADLAGNVGQEALTGLRSRLAQTAAQARPAAVRVV